MVETVSENRSPELRIVRFVLNGNPVPLSRARFGRRRVWDEQSELKVCRGLELQSKFTGPLLSGPLHLEVRFYFTPAQSLSRKKKLEALNNYHHIKPDLSNLLKFVEDIANNILYKDDCLIASIDAKKLYDDKPARTEFILSEIRK